jgi:hypothetical protein
MSHKKNITGTYLQEDSIHYKELIVFTSIKKQKNGFTFKERYYAQSQRQRNTPWQYGCG